MNIMKAMQTNNFKVDFKVIKSLILFLKKLYSEALTFLYNIKSLKREVNNLKETFSKSLKSACKTLILCVFKCYYFDILINYQQIFIYIFILDQNSDLQKSSELEDGSPKRSKMVSSIALNIPAAGLGSRPASIISTSTLDEGGFNEPSPEIKAKLRPHEEGLFNFSTQDTGMVQQKSIDSDVMYHTSSVITNSVLAELESQESQESYCKEKSREFLRNEKKYENENKSILEPLYIHTSSNKNIVHDQSYVSSKVKESEQLLLSKYDKNISDSDSSVHKLSENKTLANNSSESSNKIVESEPFLVSRTALTSEPVLNSSHHTESPKSEASILDLQDVEYADASDDEERVDVEKSNIEAEAMTQAEAENLLSSR